MFLMIRLQEIMIKPKSELCAALVLPTIQSSNCSTILALNIGF